MPTPFHDSVHFGNGQKNSVVDPKHKKEMTEVCEKHCETDSDVGWPKIASGGAMLSTLTVRTDAKGILEQKPCMEEYVTFKEREKYTAPVQAWEYDMAGAIDQTIERYSLPPTNDISSFRYAPFLVLMTICSLQRTTRRKEN